MLKSDGQSLKIIAAYGPQETEKKEDRQAFYDAPDERTVITECNLIQTRTQCIHTYEYNKDMNEIWRDICHCGQERSTK